MIKSLQDDEFKRQIEFLLGMEVELTADEINILAHATIGNEWVFKVLDKLGLTVYDIIYERDRIILINEFSKLELSKPFYNNMTPLEKFAKEYLEKNPKMTALEIFVKEMIHLGFPIPQGRYEKCMEMEKQQIGKAYHDGYYDAEGQGLVSIETQEQYYNDNYKK